MNEAVIKDEIIEETHNFTFKNGEYVEVKQEEIEEKPEYLLEKEIKTEPSDVFENNNSDCFFEDVELKPKECDSRSENVFTELEAPSCRICQKRMPKNRLKLIKSEEDKTALSNVFKFEGCLETSTSYVYYENATRAPDALIHRKKIYLMRNRTSDRRICRVCHMTKDISKLYQISSKGIRIVLMTGCVLRGTHSVDQAKSYIANKEGSTCYSHRKETIDKIFEHLGVRNIQEFFKCPTLVTGGLMDIVKNINPNFTKHQFNHAFKLLYVRKPKVSSSL
ncbi:hypothetical protein B9Z55_021058 [Caenorhabditis nigoni]|uniref:Lin-15A/B-like domain-containing protein n=1 Tax=Caenorhabditis nigoni TaxID=1611254 RepID=A0A2G5TQI2_9PELO|nr:hypothetical protein B9Z55_021058 [Caenorhabditis nigoni]